MRLQNDKAKDFTDLELIEGSIKGKSNFQEMLYRRFFSYAMSICIRYVPNTNYAIEVVNDSFVKVFDKLSRFDTSKSFKGWFGAIIVNTAIDSYRRNLKRNSTLSIDTIKDDNEVEPEIEQALSSDDIIKLFAELPDTYRLTFNLYEIEGYSHEEIGQMLGVTASTSRGNLTRAKKMLQVLYKQHIGITKKCHETV
jgi:RNA polymerase sigma-70 factor (ECF subfamily)